MDSWKGSLTKDLHILIAEDSPTQAQLLQGLLEEVGYTVSIAANGKEALAMLQQHRPTLIISDIIMPEMDGFALCREIKSREDLKDIPVILLTTLADPQDVISGLHAGADNFITKPYDEEYLLKHIWNILVNRELRKSVRTQMGVEIFFAGQRSRITSERLQILDILLSTYEAAIQKNLELSLAQEELKRLNEQLEEKVAQRTVALRTEIAERKRSEETISKLSRAIEQTQDTVIITDKNGTIEYVNPAFEALTGFTKEETIGRTPRIIKSGKHNRDFYQILWSTILSGKSFSAEFTNRKKNGDLYYEEQSITPLSDGQGKFTHFVSTGKDVTERKLLEEQFRQAQKMEAIGRLTGGIAHDMNNLLTVVLAFSDILLRRTDPDSPSFKQIKEIKKAGERAAALIDQLMAFSRKQVVQPRVLDLNAVVADVEKMLRRVISEDIDLITVLDPELGRVKVDPAQIDQIIMNLVINARDAMPDGGELTIETANVGLDENYARLHLAVQPGPYVMLAVSDTGCGMDAETRSQIFEPFFTTKEQGKGTGLGLATVFGIVKQCGGHIWVYSEPGKGTVFKVYWPQVAATGESPTPEKPLVEPWRGSGKVLVVEDEAVLRELIQELLEEAGFHVLAASNLEEALAICQQQDGRIDLLLTDVVMPKMGGRELAGRLAPVCPQMRVLYMSGYTDNTVSQYGLSGTEVAFLQKPFTEEGLLRKVREALDTPREVV